ncbi:MAG: glycoside hydrolase family 127 protein [Anaerolineae bacterium]|nr:glycoside hydrolase family 127 protein [Anaerolineae bacterium]
MENAGPVIAPYRRLQPLPPGAVHWTRGFWAKRFEKNYKVTLPSMRAAMDNPANGAVFSNFYVAAGLRTGSHVGTNWSDGDCYKWLEAVAHTYGVTEDPDLDAALDDLIGVIAQAQDNDGYINTQIQLDPTKARWKKRRHHELYNMGHLLTAASVHHRVTGKNTFLAIAQKLGDYLFRIFAPRPKDLAHFPWNPSNIMGLVDLYRETGEARYLELAETFVAMRGSDPWPDVQEALSTADPDRGDQNQDRVPLREETDAVGHAVTATYLYAGAADVVAETGETALMAALERIWQSSSLRKMYVTGGVGAYHQGVSHRGDRVHEAYGLDYELPNATAYNETCANLGNAMWAWRMLELTGDARYADVVERVIYNAGLSAVSIDGTRFRYSNPLRWYGADHDPLSHDTPERWETHGCYCCPPQVARTIARMQNWAYSQAPGELWLHLYGGNRLDTQVQEAPLSLSQTTNYPWDGRVTLVFHETPGSELTMRLRIPGWVEHATVTVNGAPVAADLTPGTYASIARTWGQGDTVVLTLPMPVRLVQAHPRVEADRNQVAVMRGPVVYCLESVDLPEGVRIDEIALPEDIGLTPWYDVDLLGGVVTLEGQAIHRAQPGWCSVLYRPLRETKATPIQIQLIPYYAWNNRGTTEMSVWLPVTCAQGSA